MTVSPDSDFFPVWKDARGWDDVLDVPVLAVRVDGLVAADVPDSTVPVLVDVPDLILFPDVCFRCSVLGSVLCSGCCYCYFSGGCLFPLCCRFLTVAGGFHFPVEVVADDCRLLLAVAGGFRYYCFLSSSFYYICSPFTSYKLYY